MAETDKPGFFGRLFGRKPSDAAKPGEPLKPADAARTPEARQPLMLRRWTPPVGPAGRTPRPTCRARRRPPRRKARRTSRRRPPPGISLPPSRPSRRPRPICRMRRSLRRNSPAATCSRSRAAIRRAAGRASRSRGRSPRRMRHPNPSFRRLRPRKKTGGGASPTACARTSSTIGESVTGLFTKRKLDAATLEDLEDVLIQADLGRRDAPRASPQAIGEGRYDKEIAPDEVQAILAGEVEKVLAPVADAARRSSGAKKPFVILMVGRQRLRQDHHHRQARPEAHGRKG